MTTTALDVVQLLSQRRAARGAAMEKARTITRHYNNEIAVPLPEVAKKEMPAVANFIAQSIDQHGMRIASVLPDLSYPAVKRGKKGTDQARDRRQAAYGWLESNAFDLLMRKRARHLIAYAASPVEILPDLGMGMPRWKTHSPLETYPARGEDELDYHPQDVIFTFTREWRWVVQAYPEIAAHATRFIKDSDRPRDTDLIEFARYLDGDETIVVCMGKGSLTGVSREAEYGIGDARIINLGGGNGPTGWAMEVDRAQNVSGCCPVIVPGRISLESAKGQLDDTPGLFQALTRMMSLEVNAVSRAVYPDTWFIRDQVGAGSIIRPADGLRGIVGEVEGGRVENLQMQPGFQTSNVISMLERGLRLNGALPAEFGGEAASNIRTDRRGQSVLSAAVDYHIDEHQRILARSLKQELYVAAEIDKAYWRKQNKSFYVSMGKAPGQVDYVPEKLWDGDAPVIVSYPFAGMDINELTVAVGQQVGIQAMSTQTAMETLATVDDPQKEIRRIDAEAVKVGLKASIQQQLAQGTITGVDAARMVDLMENHDMGLIEAFNKAHQEAQERQASVTPEGQPATAAPGSPEAQPGMAQPGQGAEVPTQGPQAPEGLMGLRGLLNSLTAGGSLTSGAA